MVHHQSLGKQCHCVGKHIPKNMTTVPFNYFQPAQDSVATVWLCPTTHDNVVKLWSIYEEYNSRPPWPILREYSEYTRYLVEKGRALRRAQTNSVSH